MKPKALNAKGSALLKPKAGRALRGNCEALMKPVLKNALRET